MITVEPFTNAEYIDAITRCDEVYGASADDAAPKDRSQFSLAPLVEDRRNIFLLVRMDGFPVGYFAFLYQGEGEWEQHTALTKLCRGRRAIEAGKQAIHWMFENGAQALRTFCFSDAPHTVWYAHQLGYETVKVELHRNTRQGQAVSVVQLKLYPEAK